jgi:hypothetical protein
MGDAVVGVDSCARGYHFSVLVAGQECLQGLYKRPSATRSINISIDERPIRLLRLSTAPLFRPGLCFFLSYTQGHPSNVRSLPYLPQIRQTHPVGSIASKRVFRASTLAFGSCMTGMPGTLLRLETASAALSIDSRPSHQTLEVLSVEPLPLTRQRWPDSITIRVQAALVPSVSPQHGVIRACSNKVTV